MEIKGTNTKNVNILERNHVGTNRKGQKKNPMMKGQKGKKSPILKKKIGILERNNEGTNRNEH